MTDHELHARKFGGLVAEILRPAQDRKYAEVPSYALVTLKYLYMVRVYKDDKHLDADK